MSPDENSLQELIRVCTSTHHTNSEIVLAIQDKLTDHTPITADDFEFILTTYPNDWKKRLLARINYIESILTASVYSV